jgi:hypothetical protein
MVLPGKVDIQLKGWCNPRDVFMVTTAPLQGQLPLPPAAEDRRSVCSTASHGTATANTNLQDLSWCVITLC